MSTLSMDERRTQALKDIFAGAMGGVAQTIAGQPFDTVKVRLQTNPHAGGVLDVVRQTLSEGPLAFYRGTLSPLIGASMCVSIQFGTVEATKRFFRGTDTAKELQYWQFFCCGALAGFNNSFVIAPAELIRIKLQIQSTPAAGVTPQYTGSIDAFRKIYAANGLGGLYKGLGSTMLRESLGFGSYFLFYEYWVKKLTGPGQTVADLAGWKVFMCGAGAGYAFWAPTYPIDVIKSRIQVDDVRNPKYRGFVDCARKVVAEDGFLALYRGFVPCMARAMPTNACIFLTFETTMRLLGRSEDKRTGS